MKKNIGILTLPFEANYGFILQAFALYRILENNGATPILLNRGWNETNISFLHRFKRKIYYEYFCRNIITFFHKINQTEIIRNSSSLLNKCKELHLESIIVGSDQVWSVPNTRGADLNYFFDFLETNSKIKKYSYAASFGKDKLIISEHEKNRIGQLLSLFQIITVREESGVDILSNDFNVESECVLDPTLLLDEEQWNLYAPLHFTKDKLVTYILDTSKETEKEIKQYAANNGLRIHNLYNRGLLPYYSVDHWLSKIRNSKFVIVDSFHGMVFAIIFKKQFIAIANKKRGQTRFVSLLSKLGLNDRLVENVREINKKSFQTIDYDNVMKKLEKERTNSMKFIIKMINS